MSELKPKTGLHYSFTSGKLDTIRGEALPQGMLVALGAEAVSPSGREVTPRAIQMTRGLFDFAELVNKLASDERAK